MYKPVAGEAVLYGSSPTRKKEAEAIVDHIDESVDSAVKLRAWRVSPTDRWFVSRGSLTYAHCEKHPNSDKIVAEFFAHVLLGRAENL
jgi:hypothetical protein